MPATLKAALGLFLAVVLLLLFSALWFKIPGLQAFFNAGLSPHFDLLIKNGTVVDGTGRDAFAADVGISNGMIREVGRLKTATADIVFDASGLTVAPGFINSHSHVDQIILKDPDLRASVLQGVTTELVGLDGVSALDLKQHFREVMQKGTSVNYGSFVGQGSVREAVIGRQNREATESEIETMKSLVARAMRDGAFGISTGLEYVPGKYTSTPELVQLAAEAGRHGGVYVSHTRNEADYVVDAVQEALFIGREAEVPVVISHIKVGSTLTGDQRSQAIRTNTRKVLDLIETSRAMGQEVFADIYPYAVPWFQMNREIGDVYADNSAGAIIVTRSQNCAWTDRTIADIAAEEGVDPGVIAAKLDADGDARVCVERLTQESIQLLLAADFTMVAMDNNIYWGDPNDSPPPHPRNYGTFPKVLSEYVREKKVLSLEEAVHRMTGLPAQLFRIPGRGRVAQGLCADLVVFDPRTVRDLASYANPQQFPQGINLVLVNGKVAARDGQYVLCRSADEQTVRAGQIIKPENGGRLRE